MFKVMYKNRVEIFIYIYTIDCFQFYYYVGISDIITKLFLFGIILIMFCLCYKTIVSRCDDLLFRLMRWILASTIISIFSAWLFREQSLMYLKNALQSD